MTEINKMATEFNTMLDKLQQRGITDASIQNVC